MHQKNIRLSSRRQGANKMTTGTLFIIAILLGVALLVGGSKTGMILITLLGVACVLFGGYGVFTSLV